MELLRAHNICKEFGSLKALSDVSISVSEGSIFGLLGPNGAGKTTLLRIINQITAPDSGELYLNGKKLKNSDVEKIGYLPEERGLYKKMKVGEQAIYLARLKGLSKHDALSNLHYWFDKFDIGPWWNKKVEELSKGMQQKVQFITTIAHNPMLLIFDEPFSGFDPINANLIKREILKLKEMGTTIIFSTHDMGSVEQLCDHIALINKSEKIVDGMTEEIRERYKSNIYKIKYKGDFEKVSSVLNASYKVKEHHENEKSNQVTIQYINGSTGNELLRLMMHICEIIAFEEVIPGMSDVFIRAVQESDNNRKV